jgi:hypothetical protein
MPKEYTWGHICSLLSSRNSKSRQVRTYFKVHNTLAGHHGVERTIKKLLDNQPSWPFYVNIVKKFVLLVPLSKDIRHQNQKNTCISIRNITLLYPMEFQHRLCRSLPWWGSCLVFTDTFTRWIELFPCWPANSEKHGFMSPSSTLRSPHHHSCALIKAHIS